MARPKNPVPTLLHHKASGQAKVRIDGRDVYLGKWNSKQAREAYARLCGELATSGNAATTIRTEAVKRGIGPSVAEVCEAWLDHARGFYVKNGKPTGELFSFRAPIKAARLLYGSTPAVEFGPLALEAVRAELAKPYQRKKRTIQRSRSVVNRYARKLVSVFRWAASRELIPASVPQTLATLPPLRAGRSALPEVAPVGPVDDATIAATLPHLSQVVADMVRLARVTGMRPGELCAMRPADVDTSGDLWIYRPTSHKTEHHGQRREVLIGPKGQAILTPYLRRPADSFCFSPREAAAQSRAARTKRRKTPEGRGNAVGSNRVRKPARTPGDSFTAGAFTKAIKRACDVAKVEQWHANQLRHSFATEARASGGLEATSGLLGHSDILTSQIYAERNAALARDVAKLLG